MQTFTDFKNNFYNKITDVNLFNCGDVNLIKVVLDGLKVDYAKKGKLNSYLFYPNIIYNCICFIKKFTSKKKEIKSTHQFKNCKILLSDVGRVINDGAGNTTSIYFDEIKQYLKKEATISVCEKELEGITDFNLSDLRQQFLNSKLSSSDILIRKNIINTYNKIKQANLFTPYELKNIKYALHHFFHQYKVWNNFLKQFPTLEKCFFVCHYHKEGQILALKNNNIKCIELQHGLISSKDIFYVFPEKIKAIKDKALFADTILLFGNYWKNVLEKGCEYNLNQMDIIGYYLFNNFKNSNTELTKLNDFINNKKVIFVTSQTSLHNYFIEKTIEIVNHINEKKLPYVILFKPHPSENIETYNSAFEKHSNLLVTSFSLPVLFSVATVHLSIYSTTLFDALRYNVKNFTFKAKGCEDYVDEILEAGIAIELIDIKQLVDDESNIKIDSTYYYQKNNFTLLN